MLRTYWGPSEAVLLGKGMFHKKFPIIPISPSCLNIKSPPSKQYVQIQTKSGTVAIMKLSFAGSLQAAVLAL